MKTILILNVLCDRVIFFTTDLNYKPLPSPYTWVSYYDGELPAGMNLGNCWSYVYRNNILKFVDEYTLEERGLPWDSIVLNRNKTALIKQLKSKKDYLISDVISAPQFLVDYAKSYINFPEDNKNFELYANAAEEHPLDYANKLVAAHAINKETIEKIELIYLKLHTQISKATSIKECEQLRRRFNELQF